MSRKPRIVIVGAGVGGLSAAWHLSPHAQVTVLEQGAMPLAEASAQNAGMVRRLVLSDHERALACRTHQRLRSLPQAPGDDWHELAPFRQTGAVIALANPTDAWQSAVASLRSSDIAIDEPTSRELATLAPALAGGEFARAYHLPEEGVCDAWSLGMGLLRGARRHGATLRTDCGVTALVEHGGRVVGVATQSSVFECDLVVLATGAWSAKLASTVGLERTLTPRARHLFHSAPHPTSAPTHPWCWIEDVGLYLRPEAGGFLMSPCDERDVDIDDGPGSRRPASEEHREQLAQKLARYCPALHELGIRGGWIGLRTFTPDRSPLLGPDPDLDGLAWIAGLGGFGISCALALGEDLAEHVFGARGVGFDEGG